MREIELVAEIKNEADISGVLKAGTNPTSEYTSKHLTSTYKVADLFEFVNGYSRKTGDGTVECYAVRMMVEEKINRGAILTEANILGKLKAINAKNVGTPQNWDTENKTELPSSVMDTYTYNIAELLENVKTELNWEKTPSV